MGDIGGLLKESGRRSTVPHANWGYQGQASRPGYIWTMRRLAVESWYDELEAVIAVEGDGGGAQQCKGFFPYS